MEMYNSGSGPACLPSAAAFNLHRRIQDFFRGGLKDEFMHSSEDSTAQVTFFNKHG